MADCQHELTAIISGAVAEDGSAVTITMADAGGGQVTVTLSRQLADGVTGALAQMVTEAQTRATSDPCEPHAVQAVAVETAAAHPSAEGQHVLLSLRATNKTPYHFALPPWAARQIAERLAKAARNAEKDMSRTRQ